MDVITIPNIEFIDKSEPGRQAIEGIAARIRSECEIALSRTRDQVQQARIVKDAQERVYLETKPIVDAIVMLSSVYSPTYLVPAKPE